VRQRNSFADWGRQLAPHYQQVQDYVRQLQQGTPPAPQHGQGGQPAKPGNPFGLPEYDPSWAQLIQKNAVTGEFEPVPGAPPDIVHRVLGYERKLRDVQAKFWQNPAEALGPILAETIKPLLQQHVQQNLGAMQDQQAAQQFVAQNGAWLYQKNPQGQPIIDPLTQQPILSAQGASFRQHLERAAQYGITSQAAQIDYAVNQTRAEILQAGGQAPAAGAAAPAAVPPGQSARDNFLQLHNRRAVNHAGSTIPAPGTPPGTPPAGQNRAEMSLADRMRQDFVAAGVSDADIAREIETTGR